MNWISQPVSRTCEVLCGRGAHPCGKPTTYAYMASRLGWMALCDAHAVNHLPYALPISHPQVKAAGFTPTKDTQ